LDKIVFLDHMSDPVLDKEVQGRVETIWKIVAHERSEEGSSDLHSADMFVTPTYIEDSSIFGRIASAIFEHHWSAPPTFTPSTSAAGVGEPITRAEVEAMIAKLAAGQKEKLDWQKSIVDLMKLLNLDSTLSARKQLAQDLGYTGALDDSAEMNVWLHKQVMTKLAESGGKVPDNLNFPPQLRGATE
jgi:Domain of unknown function (DUF3597)